MDIVEGLQHKYVAIGRCLDERRHCLWAATEARDLGHGGMALVAQATGLSVRTIRRGLRELAREPPAGIVVVATVGDVSGAYSGGLPFQQAGGVIGPRGGARSAPDVHARQNRIGVRRYYFDGLAVVPALMVRRWTG